MTKNLTSKGVKRGENRKNRLAVIGETMSMKFGS